MLQWALFAVDKLFAAIALLEWLASGTLLPTLPADPAIMQEAPTVEIASLPIDEDW